MNKAFIFDMDGVLVDSESSWIPYEKTFLPQLFGEEIFNKIGDTVGISASAIYDKAKQFGFSMDKEEYFLIYDKQAEIVYAKSTITPGLDKLTKKLFDLHFKLGIVSASRQSWINMVLPRLPFKDKLSHVESLSQHPQLRPKPFPDG